MGCFPPAVSPPQAAGGNIAGVCFVDPPNYSLNNKHPHFITCSFLVIALLRYSSQTKSSPFSNMRFSELYLLSSQCCASITICNSWTLSPPWKEASYPWAVTPFLPPPNPQSRKSLIYPCITKDLPILDSSHKWSHFLVAFCLWLLSLGVMFSRCAHIITSVCISFLCVAE